MSDLDATVAWAKATGKADVAKLGITGFCWGGRIVWLYSAHNPNLKAGVAWYGRLVGQADELHPKHPIDVAASISAPILGLYGEADQGIPVATVEQDARGPEGRRQDRRDHRLSRHPPRLLRRLPPQLPQGAGRGRLEAHARLVQEERRRLIDPGGRTYTARPLRLELPRPARSVSGSRFVLALRHRADHRPWDHLAENSQPTWHGLPGHGHPTRGRMLVPRSVEDSSDTTRSSVTRSGSAVRRPSSPRAVV